jgi:hypothetical protein
MFLHSAHRATAWRIVRQMKELAQDGMVAFKGGM